MTVWHLCLCYIIQIEIERISTEKRLELEKLQEADQRQQEESHLENMLGFTRVFRLMTQCKKVRTSAYDMIPPYVSIHFL